MNPIILAKRWDHHTNAGGYDRLAQFLDGHVVSPRSRSSIYSRLGAYLFRGLSKADKYLAAYSLEDLTTELRVLTRAVIRRPDLIHCLYGDQQVDLLLRWRKCLPCPLIATFHMPASVVRDRFEVYHAKYLGAVDAAVVVSQSQVEGYRAWFGNKVSYIPHGVNTDVITPAPRSGRREGNLKLLTVGECMRDWDVLHRVIDGCAASRLPVEFDVLVPEWRRSHLTGCRNLRLHSGVSEAALLELYRSADALLLPVTDSTANNALLESLACGTPVISTRVGGIPDYVDDSCGWLVPPGDSESMIEVIARICADRRLAEEMREAARTKALTFSWPVVAEAFQRLYASLLSGKVSESAFFNSGARSAPLTDPRSE